MRHRLSLKKRFSHHRLYGGGVLTSTKAGLAAAKSAFTAGRLQAKIKEKEDEIARLKAQLSAVEGGAKRRRSHRRSHRRSRKSSSLKRTSRKH